MSEERKTIELGIPHSAEERVQRQKEWELQKADEAILERFDRELTRLRAREAEQAAEIERLEGETDRLRAAYDDIRVLNLQLGAPLAAANAEIERLTELNEVLVSAANVEIDDIAEELSASIEQGKALGNEVQVLREAAEGLVNFAWTAVTADCEEARINLNEKITAVRAALDRVSGAQAP